MISAGLLQAATGTAPVIASMAVPPLTAPPQLFLPFGGTAFA